MTKRTRFNHRICAHFIDETDTLTESMKMNFKFQQLKPTTVTVNWFSTPPIQVTEIRQ